MRKIIVVMLCLSLFTGCGRTNASSDDVYNEKEVSEISEVAYDSETIIKEDEKMNMVYMSNDYMKLVINPLTMKVMNVDESGNEIVLSSGIDNWDVEKYIVDNGELKVFFSQGGKMCSMILKNERLIIKFDGEESGRVEFPVVTETEAFDAYILPIQEGKRIPKSDKNFAQFLQQEDWNAVELLSMPFVAIQSNHNTYTYVLANGFNNYIQFPDLNGDIGLRLQHEFTDNHVVKSFTCEISIGDKEDTAPAKVFRKYLMRTGQFISLNQKMKKTPSVKKLFGAPQIYLWSCGVLDKSDIGNWKKFVMTLYKERDENNVSGKVFSLLTDETREVITKCAEDGFAYKYARQGIIREINKILMEKKNNDSDIVLNKIFYDGRFEIKTNSVIGELLEMGLNNLREEERYRLNLNIFYEYYREMMANPIEGVGNAISIKMLDELNNYGIARAWLSGDNMAKEWMYNKSVAEEAIRRGYLIASYDSYHSMHNPKAVKWETARVPESLWMQGPIMRKNGQLYNGFAGVGRKLNPVEAFSLVKKRMKNVMENVPMNSWFVDCDAAGELYEDYNPLHLTSMEEDKNARRERLQYMIDTYGLVVGSEGGYWYLSDTIHYAQGIMTPVIAWSDEDMRKNKESEYYLGDYWPVENPAAFTKQVPMKDEYIYLYLDPKYRLPLYETVYHDSIVITSHWGSGSLKFSNTIELQSLTELLYGTVPLYNLNLEELNKHGETIQKFNDVFSPYHQKIGELALTEFKILTQDRLVQKSVFGDAVEVIVNFSDETIAYSEIPIPKMSALILDLTTYDTVIYNASMN